MKSALFLNANTPALEAQEPIWHKQISLGKSSAEAASVGKAVEQSIAELGQRASKIKTVGHRIVHGGTIYADSVPINENVKENIRRLQEFAPLHNKLNLEGIEAIERLLPGVPQVAVFDTTFHKTIPPAALIYPGPYEWFSEHKIQRYGFHGINHQYSSQRAASMLNKRVDETNLIVCHLGSGCSVTAIKNGHSIDNSMGFTPLEGLMMGTRSGSIDPGIILHLLKKGDYTASQLDQVLNTKSGLLGISGMSNDMREIVWQMHSGNERAQLAFDMFTYRLQSSIGAMAAHLQRLDAIVFTAGIGEHSPLVRHRACEALSLVGCRIDEQKNQESKSDCDISDDNSNVRVLVVAAREEWQIAKECWRVSAALVES